jgi:dGTPase
VENAWEKSRANSLSRSAEDQFFMYLRVNTLNKLVPYAAQRFIENLPQIFSGEFNHALLEDDSDYSQLLELYKNVAIKEVFSHPDVEQLELQGYRVISGLLEIYRPLLQLSLADFSELVEKERVRRFPLNHACSRSYQRAIGWLTLKREQIIPEGRLRDDGILLSLSSHPGLYQRNDGFVCMG